MTFIHGFLCGILVFSVSVSAQRDDVSLFYQLVQSLIMTFLQDIAYADKVEDLCQGRPANEYFRLTTEGDCRDVVRCDRAGIAGTIRLASVKCPSGLGFDLEKQTCDWKAKVNLISKQIKDYFGRSNFLLKIIGLSIAG